MRALLLILMLITASVSLSPNSFAKKDDERKTAKDTIIAPKYEGLTSYTIPAGTTFITTLETPLNTAFNQTDDTFRMRIIHNTWVDENIVIHKGATFVGHVEEVRQPMQGKNAELKIIPHGLETMEGEEVPIMATIFTAKKDKGTIGGEVTQPVNARLIRYEVWGIGQYNRVMPAGPRAMGQHKSFRPGQMLRVRLDKPLTLVVDTDKSDWLQ
jgi:hypothetical protein